MQEGWGRQDSARAPVHIVGEFSDHHEMWEYRQTSVSQCRPLSVSAQGSGGKPSPSTLHLFHSRRIPVTPTRHSLSSYSFLQITNCGVMVGRIQRTMLPVVDGIFRMRYCRCCFSHRHPPKQKRTYSFISHKKFCGTSCFFFWQLSAHVWNIHPFCLYVV